MYYLFNYKYVIHVQKKSLLNVSDMSVVVFKSKCVL